MLQCKLCLPLLPSHLRGTTCRCNQPLDDFGDHFFSCPKASKTKLHNTIRDTLYTICRSLGPINGLVRNRTDIFLEPLGLLPDYHRNSRPADIGLVLSSSAVNRNLPTHSYLAIDVTIPALPKPLTTAPSGLPNLTLPTRFASQAHHDSCHKKFSVDYAPHLISQGIFLLPFTVDHLGGLGPFAHSFLYSNECQVQPASTAPNWSSNNFRLPSTFDLYQNALYSPKALLPFTDSAWSTTSSSKPFGSSYHTHYPSQWATQTLGLNTSMALAKHLSSALSATSAAHFHVRQDPTVPIRYATKAPSPKVRILKPGPTFLDYTDPDDPDPNHSSLDTVQNFLLAHRSSPYSST